jgi:hypothetical protein
MYQIRHLTGFTVFSKSELGGRGLTTYDLVLQSFVNIFLPHQNEVMFELMHGIEIGFYRLRGVEESEKRSPTKGRKAEEKRHRRPY